MASSDSRRANFPGAARNSAADDDAFVPTESPRLASFGPTDTTTQYYDERSYHERPSSRHRGAGRDDPPTTHSRHQSRRFLYDESDEDFEEPAPSRLRLVRAIAFYLLMASIGSGAATIWHFYTPSLTALGGASDVQKLTDAVGNQAQEQRKLSQTISALQSNQEALQKALATREQDIERLTTEVRTLKGDLDSLRNAAAATAAPHPTIAPGAKRSASPPAAKKSAGPPAAKKEVEHSPVKPEGSEPMALSSQH